VEPNKNYIVPTSLKLWNKMQTRLSQHSPKYGIKWKLHGSNIPQIVGPNENYMVVVESPKMQDQMKTKSFCSLSLAQHNQ
jgi:hypothetical protein